MTIQVNLFNDFVENIKSKLDIGDSTNKMEVIIKYAWFDLRRLPQKKWKVHYSNELKKNPFYLNKGEFIDRIRDKAESGESLVPHASTIISEVQGKDDLLADWGIYHLHPGHGTRTARNSDFVNRAGKLLFVIPNIDDLYFIDILDHRSWTNYSLIEVIDNNWPLIIDHYKIKDAIDLAYEPTEEELYKLRKNQINTVFRVGNSIFMGPGGGIATDGSSNKAVRMAQNVKEILDRYSKQLKEEENDLRSLIKDNQGDVTSIDPLCLKLIDYDPRSATGKILEKNVNLIFEFSFT